jgi:hypothetical protein
MAVAYVDKVLVNFAYYAWCHIHLTFVGVFLRSPVDAWSGARSDLWLTVKRQHAACCLTWRYAADLVPAFMQSLERWVAYVTGSRTC